MYDSVIEQDEELINKCSELFICNKISCDIADELPKNYDEKDVLSIYQEKEIEPKKRLPNLFDFL